MTNDVIGATPRSLTGLVYAYRRVLVVALHIALWTVAFFGAFLLRFDAQFPAGLWPQVRVWLPVMLAIRVVVYFYFGMFHGLWRYTGARDLLALFQAATVSTVIRSTMFSAELSPP